MPEYRLSLSFHKVVLIGGLLDQCSFLNILKKYIQIVLYIVILDNVCCIKCYFLLWFFIY